MANALLAFDRRDFVRSQQLLDQIFSAGIVPPEAAVLRARIAIEQGNLQFAIRFLDQQIHQTGDSAGLRETFASALFLAGRLDEAETQLSISEKLGAPPWRVAYGRGLIDEARGRFREAGSRYQEALRAKPGWRQAESRFRALVASGKIQPTDTLK
jgi:tetratricopeptide (TPR) repeat protein